MEAAILLAHALEDLVVTPAIAPHPNIKPIVT
jgi:hypothetical protein